MGWLIDTLQGVGGVFGEVCHFIPNCDLVMTGLKILVLLFIVGWVRSRLGGGLIATIVMLFVGYFVLFPYWFLFGPLSIIYVLAIVGASGLVMDFVFTHEAYLGHPLGQSLSAGKLGGDMPSPTMPVSGRGAMFAAKQMVKGRKGPFGKGVGG